MIVGSRGSNTPGDTFSKSRFCAESLFPLLKNSKSVVDDKRLANAILEIEKCRF